jgi:hypothetical protein
LLRLPLTIGATDPNLAADWENVETIMVSFHGGMVRTHQNFEVGTILEIRMHDKDRAAHARVVWVSAEQTPQGLELGFEIVDEQGFWGIKFPPDSSCGPDKG